MSWTRSPVMRAIALTASVALAVIHRDRDSEWFWVAVGLIVLNVVGFLSSRSRDAGAGDVPQPLGGVSGQSQRLDEWFGLPGVVAAFAAGPERWRQVSYLYDDHFEPMSASDLAHLVWIEHHDDGWQIGVDDEAKPYLDLDIDEADDPMIGVLARHPAVEDAVHEDREVYVVRLREPLGMQDFAVLVAHALVAHHVHVAARS